LIGKGWMPGGWDHVCRRSNASLHRAGLCLCGDRLCSGRLCSELLCNARSCSGDDLCSARLPGVRFCSGVYLHRARLCRARLCRARLCTACVCNIRLVADYLARAHLPRMDARRFRRTQRPASRLVVSELASGIVALTRKPKATGDAAFRPRSQGTVRCLVMGKHAPLRIHASISRRPVTACDVFRISRSACFMVCELAYFR
jgi:hypothetical protein